MPDLRAFVSKVIWLSLYTQQYCLDNIGLDLCHDFTSLVSLHLIYCRTIYIIYAICSTWWYIRYKAELFYCFMQNNIFRGTSRSIVMQSPLQALESLRSLLRSIISRPKGSQYFYKQSSLSLKLFLGWSHCYCCVWSLSVSTLSDVNIQYSLTTISIGG